MGKTIEELFKSKQLSDGRTAAEKYEIQNSKENTLRSATGAMDLPFKAVQIARRNLSSRLRETRIEEEVTGLRVIAKAGAPVIYGTDIFKLSQQKTEMVTFMKDSVNPNNSADNGLLGNLFDKGKEVGLKLASKIGVEFPQKLIPTRISLNDKFKSGKEPDTMTTLAEIKKDGGGTLVGKLLAQNAKGTPKQIGNQVLGAGINLLKGEIKKKLFGAPKQGAQNLAKKGEYEVQYDSSARYSDTVNPTDGDTYKRNDLSSIHLQKINSKNQKAADAINNFLEKSKLNITPPPLPSSSPKLGGKLNLDASRFNIGGKLTSITDSVKGGLSGARKEGQTLLAGGKLKIGDIKPSVPPEIPSAPIGYSDTVDEKIDDVKLRNDLSTKLEALRAAGENLASRGIGDVVDRANTYSVVNNAKKNTLRTKLGIDTRSDFLNEKTQYDGESLTLKDKTLLDDYDFITFKFTSIPTGKSVNFRATLTGISETVSPTWDSAKFVGSPFNYYTYSSIERSLSFNFKVYSTSPTEHIAAWQRINFLTYLTYPQRYVGPSFEPPFIKLTIGNLYKNKECFIESLSYTIDDNAPWEVGPTTKSGMVDNAKFSINGDTTSIDNYKLPTVIDVSCTVKLVESKSTAITRNYYGFDKLPRARNDKGQLKYSSLESTSDSAEIAADANNTDELEQLQAQQNDVQVDKNVKAELSTANNATSQTSNTSQPNVENVSAPAVEKTPSYKVEAFSSGGDIIGQIYADGKLVYKKSYIGSYVSFSDKGKLVGEPAVIDSLKSEAGIFGFMGLDGKYYKKSENVS